MGEGDRAATTVAVVTSSSVTYTTASFQTISSTMVPLVTVSVLTTSYDIPGSEITAGGVTAGGVEVGKVIDDDNRVEVGVPVSRTLNEGPEIGVVSRNPPPGRSLEDEETGALVGLLEVVVSDAAVVVSIKSEDSDGAEAPPFPPTGTLPGRTLSWILKSVSASSLGFGSSNEHEACSASV